MKSLTVNEFFGMAFPKPWKADVNRRIIEFHIQSIGTLCLKAWHEDKLTYGEFCLLNEIGKVANQVADFEPVTFEFVNNAIKLLGTTLCPFRYDNELYGMDLKTILVLKLAGTVTSVAELHTAIHNLKA